MGCSSSNTAMAPASVVKVETEATESQDFHSKYAISEKLGMGSYGQVHAVRRKDAVPSISGERAVKIRGLRSYESAGKRDKRVCKASFNEASVWSRVGEHVNCVRLFESFFDTHLGYMVMETCHQNLIEYVRALPLYSELSLSRVFAQTLQGISHIHSLRICHQDIKPDNFLVGGHDNHTIKLTDFGLSVIIPEGQKWKRPCGTHAFMSPEMMQRKEYDLKTDLWSLGVTACLFLCGRFPYASEDGSDEGFIHAIANGGPPRCVARWLSDDANSFLKALLERDQESRASADSALAMPFISGSYKRECSIKNIFHTAARTGVFDCTNVKEQSPVDVILEELQEGMLQSNTKRVGQYLIDEFLQADAHMTNKLVENFWSGICPDVESPLPPSPCTSSKSTAYSSSSRSANMNTSGSTNRLLAAHVSSL